MINVMTFNIGNDGFVINLKTILFEFSAKRNAIVVNFIDAVHPIAEVNKFIEIYNKATGLIPMETVSIQNGQRLHMLVYQLEDTSSAREKAIYSLLGINQIKDTDFTEEAKKSLIKLIYKL